MNIRPLGDKILVQRLEAETLSKGGILIPDNAKEKPTQAIVLAVGSGRLLDDGTVRPLDVKKGNKVLFGKYNGTEVELDGEKLLILSEDDILAVLE